MREREYLGLVLDLGGVIVDHDNPLFYRRLSQLLNARPSDRELASFIAATGFGVGTVTTDEMFELLGERFGSSASPEQLLEAWNCHFALKEDVYSLLQSLPAERPFAICSNTNPAHWEYLNGRYELDQLAASAILSYQVRCEKPRPDIYLHAASALGRRPEECLFVDDSALNVEAARAIGFQGHHFTDFETFHAALSTDW